MLVPVTPTLTTLTVFFPGWGMAWAAQHSPEVWGTMRSGTSTCLLSTLAGARYKLPSLLILTRVLEVWRPFQELREGHPHTVAQWAEEGQTLQ